MTQNIYDNPEFFAAYSRLPRSQQGLDGAPEWPALRALLPDVRDLEVLDLGCGFGWFCRWARAQGAARVLGIDASDNMLARARAAGDDPAISFIKGDMETLELPAGAFGLAYSSLALHYVENLGRLVEQVHRALVPGSHFVVSVEHPLYTAPRQPEWLTMQDGSKAWPVDAYLAEGPRTTDWLTNGVIKQHRTLASYVNVLIRAGFELRHIEEWAPSREQIAAHPDWADERRRPPFLLLAARR